MRQLQSAFQDSAKTARETHSEISKTAVELEHVISELKSKKENSQLLATTMTNLAENFGSRGVQTFVLHNAADALQIGAQSYLDQLSGRSLRLILQLDTGDRISRNAQVLCSDRTWIERQL